MIGTFRFGASNDDSVTIRLAWSDGERNGHVCVPDFLLNQMDESWPSVQNTMSAESALAYGVFIAARSELPLYLSGDRSVWNEAWGAFASIQ